MAYPVIVLLQRLNLEKKLKAKTILTGGQSNDPKSPNFTDQAEGFINGKFKDIFFYKEDVMKNKVKTYQPGE